MPPNVMIQLRIILKKLYPFLRYLLYLSTQKKFQDLATKYKQSISFLFRKNWAYLLTVSGITIGNKRSDDRSYRLVL